MRRNASFHVNVCIPPREMMHSPWHSLLRNTACRGHDRDTAYIVPTQRPPTL